MEEIKQILLNLLNNLKQGKVEYLNIIRELRPILDTIEYNNLMLPDIINDYRLRLGLIEDKYHIEYGQYADLHPNRQSTPFLSKTHEDIKEMIVELIIFFEKLYNILYDKLKNCIENLKYNNNIKNTKEILRYETDYFEKLLADKVGKAKGRGITPGNDPEVTHLRDILIEYSNIKRAGIILFDQIDDYIKETEEELRRGYEFDIEMLIIMHNECLKYSDKFDELNRRYINYRETNGLLNLEIGNLFRGGGWWN